MYTLVLPRALATARTDLGILLFETFVNLFDLNGPVELKGPVRNSQTKQVPPTQQRSLFLPPQTPPTRTHTQRAQNQERCRCAGDEAAVTVLRGESV